MQLSVLTSVNSFIAYGLSHSFWLILKNNLSPLWKSLSYHISKWRIIWGLSTIVKCSTSDFPLYCHKEIWFRLKKITRRKGNSKRVCTYIFLIYIYIYLWIYFVVCAVCVYCKTQPSCWYVWMLCCWLKSPLRWFLKFWDICKFKHLWPPTIRDIAFSIQDSKIE